MNRLKHPTTTTPHRSPRPAWLRLGAALAVTAAVIGGWLGLTALLTPPTPVHAGDEPRVEVLKTVSPKTPLARGSQATIEFTVNALGTVTETLPVDVMLALDVSASMNNNQLPSGETRFEAAVEAGQLFTDQVLTGTHDNRVGLVTFANGGLLRVFLTPQKITVDNALGLLLPPPKGNGAHQGSYTNIWSGITKSAGHLQSEGRTDKERAIILLSDGEANCIKETPDTLAGDGGGDDAVRVGNYCNNTPALLAQARADALAAADAAVAQGFIIYAIGFGDPSGNATLQEIADRSLDATGKGGFFYALDADELEQVYEDIARQLQLPTATNIKIIDLLPAGVSPDFSRFSCVAPGCKVESLSDGVTKVTLLVGPLASGQKAVRELPITVNWRPTTSGPVNLAGSKITYTDHEGNPAQKSFTNPTITVNVEYLYLPLVIRR